MSIIKQVKIYKEETGKDPYILTGFRRGCESLPSWGYVEWLENRVDKLEDAQNTSTNSVSPKLPTLEETRNGIVAAGICSNFGLDTNAFGDGIRAAHDFISRQLRA